VSDERAIEIARGAAASIHPWLGDAPEAAVRRDRFGDVRDEPAGSVSSFPPDDLPVWTVRLFDPATGQGATVIIDASSGQVLQAASFTT
jgi:Peptidase propeptide and YPEB domain